MQAQNFEKGIYGFTDKKYLNDIYDIRNAPVIRGAR